MGVHFLMQIKHTNGAWEKGVVVKESLDDALQGYHAYLGAYAYGHDMKTDYVFAAVFDSAGVMLEWEVCDSRDPEDE